MFVLGNSSFVGSRWTVFVFQLKQVSILSCMMNYIPAIFYLTTTQKFNWDPIYVYYNIIQIP